MRAGPSARWRGASHCGRRRSARRPERPTHATRPRRGRQPLRRDREQGPNGQARPAAIPARRGIGGARRSADRRTGSTGPVGGAPGPPRPPRANPGRDGSPAAADTGPPNRPGPCASSSTSSAPASTDGGGWRSRAAERTSSRSSALLRAHKGVVFQAVWLTTAAWGGRAVRVRRVSVRAVLRLWLTSTSVADRRRSRD